jgi:hypothetical protein
MAKTIGLKIEIEGLTQITKEVTALEQDLKDLNAELKKTAVGSDEYIKLKNQIVLTQDALKDAKKEQRDFIKDAKAADFEKGSYYDLNKQLVDLKKAYKNLSEEERNSAKGQEMLKNIQKLDKELKAIDANIGQFQRNVGNYPKTFQIVSKSLMKTIPGFEEFSNTLKDAEGNINIFGKALIGGFVAFQGAKLIGQAMKQIDEFISKINETKETVAEFSGAYGEDLNKLTADTTALAETFNTDAKSISEAAQALSQQLGIGFEEALGKLEGALVQGQGNADDYLSTIAEYPEAFKEAGNEVTDFSERNRNMLATNKELAQSQVNVAERLQGLNDGFKNVANQVKTGLLVGLANLIDFLKPVVQAFMIGARAIFDFYSYLGNLIIQIPIISQLFTGLKNIATVTLDAFRNMPFIFSGIVEGIKQLGTNFVNFFQSLYLDAQIFAQQVKGVFGANVQDAIDNLRKQRAEVMKDQMTIVDAFNKGYNDAKKKADAEAQKQQKTNVAAIKKIDTEAQKAAIERQREAAKKLKEERDKFTEQEAKDARARAALLADLQARVIDESIKNIQDQRKREEEETKRSFQKQIEELDKNYKDLQLAAQEREAELLKIFGANSSELLKVQKANTEQLQAVLIEQGKIRAELEKQQVAELKKIDDDYRNEQIQKAQETAEQLRAWRDEALGNEIDYIESIGQQREQKNQETLNRLLIQETDAKKREELVRLAAEQDIIDKIALVRNKLQAVDDQEANLKAQAEAGVEIKQAEYDAILKARQELNTELSALELQQTENVRTNAEKQKQIFQQQFEKVAGAFEQGLQLLDGFIDAAAEREQARLDEATERSQKREEQLNKELEGATGLRRRFIQQQIDGELAAQEQLDKKKEALAKKQANIDKGIAITQSIIQGAVAVVRALATGGPIAATLAGILAASQTALIASKKFENGGLIQGPSHADGGVPFTVQGRGGFEAEGGEFIVNKKATAKFLPVLQKINSVKFAQGGLIGGVPTAPTVSGSFGVEEQIRSFNERTMALNRQQLETRVYLVTDDLDRDNANKERIEKRVKLR